jgi:formate hydrogenlyase transcriptional activator
LSSPRVQEKSFGFSDHFCGKRVYTSACIAQIRRRENTIVLASTTSTQDSGLFEYLLPIVRRKTAIVVKVVALPAVRPLLPLSPLLAGVSLERMWPDSSLKCIREMKEAADHFRLMIDSIPVLAWCCRPDGTTEFLNQRWLDYTGLSSEEALGLGWKVPVHPDDLRKLKDTWTRLLTSGEPGEEEARLRRFDGEYRWFLFRAVPVRSEQGNVIRWYGTNTDIEDRKRAEERLRHDELDIRRTMDALPALIYVLGTDFQMLYKNQTLLDHLGANWQENLQKEGDFARTVHPDDLAKVQRGLQEGLALGLPFQLECRARRHDGQYRWYLTLYNPLRDEQGIILRWCAAATDIDDRKQAEQRVLRETLALRDEIDRSSMFEEIVGTSASLRRVLTHVAKVAQANSTVLILGETGTGKELIARAIHKRSSRSDRAFIRVNCAAIPPSLIASELFGHEKGAFTGATQRRLGRFESANGGTIFLDEIGDIPADTQIALLRVLQEREIERVGSGQPISVDVRIIAATNRDLKGDVAAGAFRPDLFYRLNVFPIDIPPLRQRADDIPLLAEYLIERYAKKSGKNFRHISKQSMELIQAYHWPGNVRELQNVVERAVVLCEGDTFTIDEAWLKPEPLQTAMPGVPFLAAIADREKSMIQAALVECQGRISGPNGAAAKLGIPRQTLDSKIANLGINKYLLRGR